MAKGDLLGEFELYVMLALAHLGDAAYGITVRREIEARTGRTVAIGAVYATLARLEEKGLVRFLVSAPQPVQGDAPENTSASPQPGSGRSVTQPR
jgi:PadR family transcriptional regulator, regulatory protein PadR